MYAKRRRVATHARIFISLIPSDVITGLPHLQKSVKFSLLNNRKKLGNFENLDPLPTAFRSEIFQSFSVNIAIAVFPKIL